MGKSSSDLLVGRTIAGKFLVEGLIGSGAMGAVYRAKQIALDKTIAIKVLHVEHAADATFTARFQREAKAASRLNHPNSMQVIDFGEEPDGLLYIAMEYLDGRSLHRVLRDERPLPPARVADILMQTLAALAVAHDQGVVHRDLKPENIVVLRGTDDDGRPTDLVKVCDFGIAKITDSRAYRSGEGRESNAPVTTAGFLVGTPEYMSPEQGRGEKLDARSDLYSVGVILYEMLTGRVPFEAENAIGVVLKHITEMAEAPSAIAPDVDPRLEAVCLRAMRKGRDERFQTAREMRAELKSAHGGGPSPSRAPEIPSVRVLPQAPAIATAATVEMELPSGRAVDESPPKPTLAGTSATVPGPPHRRTALVAAAISAVIVGFGAVLLLRPHAPPAVTTAVASASSPPETTLLPEPVPGDDVPPLDPTVPSASAVAGGGTAPRASHGPQPVAAASARSLASGVAPGAPIALAPSAAPPAAVADPPPVVTASPADTTTAAAADPDFDPDKAFVEVGLINVQGVRERAVRAAVRNLGLSGCYRRALRAKGARAVGTATLDLSVDEGGAIRSAIASGAEFLPGLTRCVQGAASQAVIPKAMVDSGGGTAEVTLAFRAP